MIAPAVGRSASTPAGTARSGLAGIGGYAACMALIAVLVVVRRVWAAEVALVPLLLTVPGALLLRALRVPGAAVASFPVYVPAASLAVLIASGLGTDIIGPLAGTSQPLRAAPLLAGFEISCAVLLAAGLRAPAEGAIAWRALFGSWRAGWPLIIPLVAAAGALRLNSGHQNTVAIAALIACLGALIWAMAAAPRLDKVSRAIILYAISLSMMWSFSLRGILVYGYDISTEYSALHQTIVSGVWHFGHPGDAYGALLSVTVLPAELHALSGVTGLMVLKLVYPAINALFTVGVFNLARRIVSRRWALAAAAFIAIQSPFSQELPAIARQEIALIFFIALFGAIFDTRLNRGVQWSLTAIFGLGMAFSHYSTTYFTLAMLAGLFILQWAASLFRDIPRVTGAVLVALLVSTVCAVVWYGPVTRSASNVSQFIAAATSKGFDLLPNQVAGGNLLSGYLQGNIQTSISAAQYQRQAQAYYAASRKFVIPRSDASSPRYALKDATVPEPAVRLPLAGRALNLAEVIAEQLAELLGGLGAVAMSLRRKTPVLARQFALLGFGTLLLLAVIRLSGTVAVVYNQERAFVQSFAVLAITLSWSLQYLGSTRPFRRLGVVFVTAATAALVVIFAQMSGLAAVALGGGADTNLASSGEDFERFNMTTQEFSAATWLSRHVQPGQLVYADRYGQLPLFATTGISQGLMNDITPLTLDQHAWVYASTANVVDGRARALLGNDFAVYAFPSGFLTDNYDMLYNDGSAEVFHG